MDACALRALRASAIGLAAFFALIFLPAGTLNYWQGWVFFLTVSLLSVLVTIDTARRDKSLLASRLAMGPRAETRPRQKRLTALAKPLSLLAIVLIVLAHRFHLATVPAAISLAGDALGILGLGLYGWVVRANPHAAAIITVTPNQKLIATGPYAIIRHPMYTGALLVILGMPLALGSYWGLLLVPAFATILALRLLDEEKALRTSLPGYTAYTHTTPYRLVPRIW